MRPVRLLLRSHRCSFGALLAAALILTPCASAGDASTARPPAWTYATNARILSSASSADGELYIGSDDRHVYALDGRTGELHWKRELTAAVRSQPLIAGAEVLVVSGNDIFALARADGHVVWAFSPEDEAGVTPADPWDYHQSSAIVAGQSVYYGGGNGEFYGLDRAMGKPRFTFAADARAAIRTRPTVDGSTVFFGDWNGVVYALDAGTGELRWKQPTLSGPKPYPQFGAVVSGLVIRDGRLYLGLRNPDVICLDTRNGKVLWTFTAENGSWVAGTPLLADDTLYITGSDDHRVHALDAQTGKQRWACDVGLNMFIAPLLVGDHLIVSDADSYAKDAGTGHLHCIDRKTGKLERSLVVGGNVGASSPLLVEGRVIVGSEDGRVLAYALEDLVP